jgi:hypothetical protein
MWFSSKRDADLVPNVDKRGIFRAAVHEALCNILSGYRSTQWDLYRDAAADLEDFARQVRFHVATHRPL